MKTTHQSFIAVISLGLVSWLALIAQLTLPAFTNWFSSSVIIVSGLATLFFAEGFFDHIEKLARRFAADKSWNGGVKFLKYNKALQFLGSLWLAPAMLLLVGFLIS